MDIECCVLSTTRQIYVKYDTDQVHIVRSVRIRKQIPDLTRKGQGKQLRDSVPERRSAVKEGSAPEATAMEMPASCLEQELGMEPEQAAWRREGWVQE